MIIGDAPIRGKAEDRFGRARLAERIAAEVVDAPSDQGFVMALCGPWGTGKTSLMALVEECLGEKIVVLRFNPWLFSGTEDLVARFFAELAAVLSHGDDQLRKIAVRLARYAGSVSGLAALIPGAGLPLAATLNSVQQAAGAGEAAPTLEERYNELREALDEFDERIVVLVDDLDRLSDQEVREVVRLVKLVGDLPRLTYILAFDRERLEDALGRDAADPADIRQRGRAYLEKIVQSRYDVPPLRRQQVLKLMFEQFDAAIATHGEPHLHEVDWQNMVGHSIQKMVRTPRDAKRLANAVGPALALYGEEVALVDILGLEVLRILEPDVHSRLSDLAEILVGTRLRLGDEQKHREEDSQRVDAVVAKAQHPDEVRAMLGQLFPRAGIVFGASPRSLYGETKERRDKRVALSGPFRAYLYSSLDEGTLPVAEVQRFVALLSEPSALASELAALGSDTLEDLVGRLLDYSDSFQIDGSVEAAAALVDQEYRLVDESPFWTFRAPATWQLFWVVEALLRTEQDPVRRADRVRQLYDRVTELSSRLRVIDEFSAAADRPEEDRQPDAELLSEDEAADLRNDLKRRVRDSRPEQLVGERLLGRLLLGLVHGEETNGRRFVREKCRDDALMLAVLKSFRGVQQRQSLGEAAVRQVPYIGWSNLLALFNEDELKERVLQLAGATEPESLDAETREALELARQIAAGEADPEAHER